MKTQTRQLKWISASLLALTLTSGVQAFGGWNNWNVVSPIQIKDFQYNFPIMNCVVVPELPERFQRTTTRTIIASEGGQYTELKSNITSVTSTFISVDTEKYTYSGVIEVDGGFISAASLETGEMTSTFSIANGYKDITEEAYVARDYLYENNNSFTPFLRKTSGTICENKTWNSSYHHISEVISGSYPISAIFPVSTINTIESVNIEKTVEAGTFTTYQHKVEYGDKVITHWIDIETGVLVASEARDGSSDEVIATKELIDLIIPFLGEPPVYPSPLLPFVKFTKMKPIIPAISYFGKK